MENLPSKRQKTSNFTAKETEILISLVQKHREGVACNKTDVKNEIRKQTWEKICSEFNATSESYRSVVALKNRYKNVKAVSMKKFSESRSYSRGTGGGPRKVPNITTVDEIIKDIHGTQIEGKTSQYDADSFSTFDIENMDVILKPAEETTETNFEIEEEEEEEGVSHKDSHKDKEHPTTSGDWGNYNPIKLRQAKDKALRIVDKQIIENAGHKESNVNRIKRNDSTKTKVGAWVKTKIELNEIQTTHLQQEWNQKIEHLQAKQKRQLQAIEEEHKKKIKLLEEESELRKFHMSEEHKLKMEILELQKAKFL